MEREYYLDSDIKRQSLIGALIVIGLREIMNLSLLLGGGDRDIVTYILLLLGTISISYGAIVAHTEKIVVSPKGIAFKRLGLNFFIRWEDIERIDRKRILGVSYQGIFAPKDKVKFEGFESSFIYRREISINLFRYSDNWRESELGQQIKQYVPNLLKS